MINIDAFILSTSKITHLCMKKLTVKFLYTGTPIIYILSYLLHVEKSSWVHNLCELHDLSFLLIFSVATEMFLCFLFSVCCYLLCNKYAFWHKNTHWRLNTHWILFCFVFLLFLPIKWKNHFQCVYNIFPAYWLCKINSVDLGNYKLKKEVILNVK